MRVAAVLAAAALAVPAAHAGVILGVHGNAGRFASLTGQQSEIRHTFMTYGDGSRLNRILSTMSPVPLLALNTTTSQTPRAIALGRTDQFLFQLNAAIAAWPGDRFYVRPFPEMNAYWAKSCAYNANGSPRGAAYSTRWNRKALARIAVILRGGTHDAVDAQLAELGLPQITADLPVTTPKLRIVWNRQGFGAPDVPGNSAQAYYRATRMSTSSATISTTSAVTARRGPLRRRSTRRIHPSRTRSPNGASGVSTIRRSCAGWRRSSRSTGGSSSSRTSPATRAPCGILRRSRRRAPHTAR